MIQLQHIGFRREQWVLRSVDLTVKQGELLGIIGHSGAGKTTLLKLIAGMLDLEEGTILFKGETLVGPSGKLIPGYEDIQLVNQDFALEPYHTVEENIREKILNLPKEDQRFLAADLLDLVELDGIKNRQARLLSGGEQQRLSIARALACEPEVLLLDEPFVHLDYRLRLKIMKYLLKLNEVRNTTIVLVSHDGSEMMGFVDHIVHVSDAGIVRRDSAANMFYHPDSVEQGELMGLINSVEIDGGQVLFRPNEYNPEGTEIVLTFKGAMDTGLHVFNYFTTEDGTEIVLTAAEELGALKSISVEKK